ncbi:MAG TPA: FMN-binding protein [Angustibacter sp.]|nr:FMN-binding protein [Angustibacter sp.]
MVSYDPSAAAARERGVSRRRLLGAAGATAFGVAALFVYPTSHGASLAGGPIGTVGTAGLTGTAPGGAAGSGSSGASGSSGTSGGTSGSGDGTFTGDTVQTRWGPVQVQIRVSGGKITDAGVVQVPQNNQRDLEINSYAVPVLNSEVVQAQSAQIDTVSGATVTSDGYLQSLQSAIDAANLG